MRRQWNLFQTKEQNETSEEELREVEISNLLDKELKVLIIKDAQHTGDRWTMLNSEKLKSWKT